MIEKERKPSVVEDEASWLRRLAEIDVKRERLLDLRLDRDITLEQFRVRSTELKDARRAVEGQLEAARSRLFASKTSSAPKMRSSRTTPPRAAGAGRTLLGREKSGLQDNASSGLRPPRRHTHCRLGL